jgi:hypothetical protein
MNLRPDSYQKIVAPFVCGEDIARHMDFRRALRGSGGSTPPINISQLNDTDQKIGSVHDANDLLGYNLQSTQNLRH